MSQNIFFWKAAAFLQIQGIPGFCSGSLLSLWSLAKSEKQSLERRPDIFLKYVIQNPISMRYPLK